MKGKHLSGYCSTPPQCDLLSCCLDGALVGTSLQPEVCRRGTFPIHQKKILHLIPYLGWIKQIHNEVANYSFYLIFHDRSVFSAFDWTSVSIGAFESQQSDTLPSPTHWPKKLGTRIWEDEGLPAMTCKIPSIIQSQPLQVYGNLMQFII